MKKVKISVPSIIWLGILIYFKTPFIFALLCAIILHELGHVIFARALKVNINRFHLSILGAALEIQDNVPYFHELLLTIGGPLFGVIGAIAGHFFYRSFPNLPFSLNFVLPFSIISAFLSVFNLIPLATLDGGKILKCLARMIFSLEIADKILQISSFCTLFTLWLFSVYAMLKFSFGVPMFIFCLIFFAKCFIF